MEDLPADHFATSAAYTPHLHRDMYPAIDPAQNATLSQAGRVVVLAGASTGIGGRGIAPVFAAARPRAMVLAARSLDGLEKVRELALQAAREAGAAEGEVQVVVHALDCSDPKQAKALWDKVGEQFGHADVLVSSMGSMGGYGAVGEADPDKWFEGFEVNVRGFYALVHGFVGLLGPERKGYVVNIGASMSTYVQHGMSSYGISKLAAWKICEYLTTETKGRVQAVSMHPGIVETQLTMDIFRKFALDTPKLVGGTALWLSTDQASFLSGKLVNSNWDVEELLAKKAEIEASGDLSMSWHGKFGIPAEIV